MRVVALDVTDTCSLDAATQRGFRALNSVVRPVVESGVVSPPPIGTGAVVLETTGRISGKPRRVPLAAMRLGDRIAVSTVRSDSQWLANLEASPTAKLRVDGHERTGTATVTRGPLNVAVITLSDAG